MKRLQNIFAVVPFLPLLLSSTNIFILGQQSNQSLVDYYVNLVTNHTEKAFRYKFPSDARMYEAVDKTPEEYGLFDFVVIGGGTAGCVIAGRLSERRDFKVLLLEAGNFRDEDLTRIPALALTDGFSKFNWGFYSVKQKTCCLGMVDQKCFTPRGKGVGGSSLINGIVYTRSNKRDYNRWAELLNDPNWTYENVLSFFKKSETFKRTNPFVPTDYSYHGYHGPLQMSQCTPPQNISNTILRGIKEFGYNITDYNGREQMGGSVVQYYLKDGFRDDPDLEYVFPAQKLRNFKALDKSYVIKIDINEKTKRVRCVVFTRENKTYIARVRKEVILSAGAISSPQILMLSGIGPQDHLKSLNISVIQNLPVGTTLRDHAVANIPFFSNVSGSESLEQSAKDFLKGQGALTRSLAFDAVGWLKTSQQPEHYPNVEYQFQNFSASLIPQIFYGYTNETYRALTPDVSNPFTIGVMLLHTVSNGTIRLNSSSPFDYPLINPNLLSDEGGVDIANLYEGVQLFINLTKTEAFRSMNFSLAVNEFPGCNGTEPLSKEFWYCYLRSVSSSVSHQVATCLTGTSPDNGVVDSKLRVFGVCGLRVADTSVAPFPVGGHTSALALMIGEKAADIIKRTYRV